MINTKQNRRNQGQETITREELIGIFFLLGPWGAKFWFWLRFFLFMLHLNMQASIACILGLVTCYLNENNMAASAGVVAPKGAVLLFGLKNQCGPSRNFHGFSTISWGGPYCTSLVICCGPSHHFPGLSTISWGEDLVQALWFCWSIFFARVLNKFGLKGSTYARENKVTYAGRLSLYHPNKVIWQWE